MCKSKVQRTPATSTESDLPRRVGRPNNSRQAIPALPDPLTGYIPAPAGLGNTRLKAPVIH